jgi:hypothetical protein
MAGFILGFDTDREGVADELVAYIEASSIPVCMVGKLAALPGTQLERRLMAEGRLHTDRLSQLVKEGVGDQCSSGLNFDTSRPRQDVLKDFEHVLTRIYSPEAFFARVRSTAERLRPACHHVRSRREVLADTWLLMRVFAYILLRHPRYLAPFAKCFRACARTNPGALKAVGTNAILYLHVGPFARFVRERLAEEIARLEAEASVPSAASEPPGPRKREPARAA